MIEEYDIIVVGAGLVGLSFVAALRQTGLKIAVLETHLPMFDAAVVSDGRPLALTYGSHVILKTMDVWPTLAEWAVPIETIHISEQGRFGGVHFRAKEEQVPALGYVVPFERLQRALYQTVALENHARFIPIHRLLQIESHDRRVTVRIQTAEGEKILQSALLIGADGAESSTRRLLGIEAVEHQSGEQALTATLQLPQPHQNTAHERFTAEGVLAVLPLKNTHQARLVWVLKQEAAVEIAQKDAQALSRIVQTYFNDRLGDCRVLERGKLFPLQTLMAEEQIRPGVVLLGNAAHTLYPIAAQGFNLGLRDAVTLADVIVSAHDTHQALGDEKILASYLEWRRSDQRWTRGFTGGVHQLFDLQWPGLGLLRSVGLLAMDLAPPLKHRLARRLMGRAGRLSRLARGLVLSPSSRDLIAGSRGIA